MQLDQIKADIRIRSPWEAIDLGFRLVQAWWKLIYAPWVILLITLAVLNWILVPEEYHAWAFAVIWWLKPVYDRLLLHILSQELFSSQASTWQRLRQLPSVLKGTGLLSGLTYRRFSFSRSLNLPIWQLERLKSPALGKRQNLLHVNAHSQSVWLTIVGLHIEMIIYFAFFGLVFLWLPEYKQETFFSQFFTEQNLSDITYWVTLVGYIFYIGSVLVVEPFYVSSGFSLYLNRRTQLEAWDIELIFRNMAQRLEALKQSAKQVSTRSSVLMAFCAALLIGGMIPQASYAADEPVASERLGAADAKRVITEVIESDDLNNKQKITIWRLKDSEEPDIDLNPDTTFFENLGKFFALIFEFGLWIAVIVAVALLFIYRDSWLYLFQNFGQKEEEKAKPEVLFGMDIRPESLPRDIVAMARSLWQEDKKRDAMSLLYRGTLATLVNKDDLPLEDSHTEGDILRVSHSKLANQREQYLDRLTQQWKSVAYAHRYPSDEEASYLFDHWAQHFALQQEKSQDEVAL